jgi:hypothetical protein
MEERDAVIDGLALDASGGRAAADTSRFVEDQGLDSRIPQDPRESQTRDSRPDDDYLLHESAPA